MRRVRLSVWCLSFVRSLGRPWALWSGLLNSLVRGRVCKALGVRRRDRCRGRGNLRGSEPRNGRCDLPLLQRESPALPRHLNGPWGSPWMDCGPDTSTQETSRRTDPPREVVGLGAKRSSRAVEGQALRNRGNQLLIARCQRLIDEQPKAGFRSRRSERAEKRSLP